MIMEATGYLKYIAKDGYVTSSEEDAKQRRTGKKKQSSLLLRSFTRLTYKNWDLGINGHGSFRCLCYNYVKASDPGRTFMVESKRFQQYSRSTLEADLRRIASTSIASWRKATSSGSATLR